MAAIFNFIVGVVEKIVNLSYTPEVLTLSAVLTAYTIISIIGIVLYVMGTRSSSTKQPGDNRNMFVIVLVFMILSDIVITKQGVDFYFIYVEQCLKQDADVREDKWCRENLDKPTRWKSGKVMDCDTANITIHSSPIARSIRTLSDGWVGIHTAKNIIEQHLATVIVTSIATIAFLLFYPRGDAMAREIFNRQREDAANDASIFKYLALAIGGSNMKKMMIEKEE